MIEYCTFATALGTGGIAWGANGVVGVALPVETAAAAREQMERRFRAAAAGTAPADVQAVVDGIVSLMLGERVDLSQAPVDMSGIPEFNRRVYELTMSIPPGKTLSYGEIATRLGDPGAARAVGQAMGHNPFAPVVPCHRVVGAAGKLGGFSATGGTATKVRLLAIEAGQGQLFL